LEVAGVEPCLISSLKGGEGTILGTVLGALIIATLFGVKFHGLRRLKEED
jgi:predicted ABC-type sugar transport system permease subunit